MGQFTDQPFELLTLFPRPTDSGSHFLGREGEVRRGLSIESEGVSHEASGRCGCPVVLLLAHAEPDDGRYGVLVCPLSPSHHKVAYMAILRGRTRRRERMTPSNAHVHVLRDAVQHVPSEECSGLGHCHASSRANPAAGCFVRRSPLHHSRNRSSILPTAARAMTSEGCSGLTSAFRKASMVLRACDQAMPDSASM